MSTDRTYSQKALEKLALDALNKQGTFGKKKLTDKNKAFKITDAHVDKNGIYCNLEILDTPEGRRFKKVFDGDSGRK
nr:hypothetical protein 27 [Candidatus Omnitrophota bacterium]